MPALGGVLLSAGGVTTLGDMLGGMLALGEMLAECPHSAGCSPSEPHVALGVLLDPLQVSPDGIQRCHLIGEGLRSTCGEPLSRPGTRGGTGDGVDDAVELDLPQDDPADMVLLVKFCLPQLHLGELGGLFLLVADRDGETPLTIAAAGPDGETLLTIAVAGADGETLLTIAAAGAVMLALLLKVVHIRDETGIFHEDLAVLVANRFVQRRVAQMLVELLPGFQLSPAPNLRIIP